jgi:type II secretion system protein G
MNKQVTTSRKPSGFTLIELLIVVAIIAILAAIAVPNFLEAQTRSKISRARADMRTVATALETYYVDTNHYPWTINDFNLDVDGYGNPRFSDTLTLPNSITSPVSYLTSLPADVFKIGKNINGPGVGSSLGRPYQNGNARDATFLYLNMVQDKFWIDTGAPSFYSAASWGPRVDDWGLWQMRSLGPSSSYSDSNGVAVSFASINSIYDATNGTISFGHIIRTQKQPEGAQKE